MRRYVVYRVSDRLPNSAAGCSLLSSRQEPHHGRCTASKGECSNCSQPVWFLPENLEDRVLVRWSCANKSDHDQAAA